MQLASIVIEMRVRRQTAWQGAAQVGTAHGFKLVVQLHRQVARLHQEVGLVADGLVDLGQDLRDLGADTVVEIGDGAELRSPMAITVISGLVASTVLTLLIIPSVYVVFDRLIDRGEVTD